MAEFLKKIIKGLKDYAAKAPEREKARLESMKRKIELTKTEAELVKQKNKLRKLKKENMPNMFGGLK